MERSLEAVWPRITVPRRRAQLNGTAEDTPDPRRWLTLAVVLPAAFLGTLDFFIVNVAMPSIRDSLHASDTHLQFVIAAYGLAYAVCLITGGRLGDLYGRRRSFLCGVAGFTVASVLCGLALRPEHLVAARALQGVSGALMFPQVLSIIHVSFPERERGLAFGLFGASQGAAALAGLLVGGVLVGANLFDLQWRPIFLVNLPLGVLTLLAAGRLVRESRAPVARRLDLGGVALVSITLLLLVLPLAEGRKNGWPWWATVSLCASAATLLLFLRYENWLKGHGGSPARGSCPVPRSHLRAGPPDEPVILWRTFGILPDLHALPAIGSAARTLAGQSGICSICGRISSSIERRGRAGPPTG